MQWVKKTWAKLHRIEPKLLLLGVYIITLIYTYFTTHSWLMVLYVHLVAVFLYSIYHFGRDFLFICIAPLMALGLPILTYELHRYLRQFKQNTPAEVAIILGYSDWFKLEAWIKPNAATSEVKWLVTYLKAKKQDFSFYIHATAADVERIMADKNIKEVYFMGHGSSHIFQLSTDNLLYYCDFNDARYGKEFVHQVHCGTPDGKSLIDYVVPEGNRNGCFLYRKSINAFDVEKDFKKRTQALTQ